MSEISTKNKTKAILAVLTALFTTVAAPLFFSNNNAAYAMGDNPGNCQNLEQSTILRMVIHANGKTYHPTLNNNLQFTEKVGQTYSVTLYVYTKPTKTPHSIFISQDAVGYSQDTCIQLSNPPSWLTVQRIGHHGLWRIEFNGITMGQAAPGVVQNDIYFDTFWYNNNGQLQVGNGPTYTVNWVS